MPELTRFDTDPDALAWARSAVERLVTKYRRFEAQCSGEPDRASQWRKFANLLELELIGGKTCVITPFDERRPAMLALRASAEVPEPESGRLKDA